MTSQGEGVTVFTSPYLSAGAFALGEDKWLIQNEKLENADNDLKEIDNSLNRAAKQMKTIAKMIATDKLIMCLIGFILLAIIAVVIVFFVLPSSNEDGSDQNTKQDTFKN